MDLSRTTIRSLAAGAALSLTLAVAGCGDAGEDETAPPVEQPGQDADAEDTTGEEDTGEAGEDHTDTGTNGEEDSGGSDGSNGAGADGPHTGLLAAIDLAQEETGGTAFEVDDADGGNWEIYIADGDDELEVHISGDGTEVLDVEREDSLDGEDRAGLDAATVTISEAIDIAAEHGTGDIDDINLDDEDGGVFAWEVTFTDDTEVYIDVSNGEVLRVETD
ncbi:MAG TPA: PepSY domain-containing protein [Beutenbergiaceae bacterium]|nr:PepSY domain-containing protein [Beutenbergiaceae bacterium]